MSGARAEDGFTLVELLIVCTLSILLLGATLDALATMQKRSDSRMKIDALQDETRNTLDRMARQMRNLASLSDNPVHPLEVAGPQDIVFRSVSPVGPGTAANPTNIRRVRYCLSGTRLYEQTQVLADPANAPPLSAACPMTGNGWQTEQVSPDISNAGRVVFGYVLNRAPAANTEVTTATTTADLESVVGIRTTLFVDDDPRRPPLESSLSTEVFLRNQNRPPVAAFTGTTGVGTSIALDGGDSYDPEGAKLTFDWYDGGVWKGSGAIFHYSAGTGGHSITLKVTDASGNSATTAAQTFTCTTSGGCH
jgi:type II secretory pathway component PulJ